MVLIIAYLLCADMQLIIHRRWSILKLLIGSTELAMNTLSTAFSGGAILIFFSTLILAALTLVSVTSLVAPVACVLERYFGLL